MITEEKNNKYIRIPRSGLYCTFKYEYVHLGHVSCHIAYTCVQNSRRWENFLLVAVLRKILHCFGITEYSIVP